jgi:O-antigen/teichoic acid export membrane protein
VRNQLLIGRSQAVLTVATISLGRIDQVFLSFLGSARELGVYVVAATAAQVSLPMARGFADVVLPDVFARPGEDISPRATALVFAISATIGAASAAVAPWLVPALFGEPFRDSVPLLWLLIPGQVLFNTAWVISARHLGGGSPRVAARAIAIAATVNLVLIAPAVAAFGPEGAAVLTSACQALYLAGVWIGRD